MVYEKLRGDHLFDGENLHDHRKVLIIDESNNAAIIDECDAGDDVRYIPGLITPGFANVHCHLELCHMKGKLPIHSGLTKFLLGVIQQRNYEESEIQDAIMMGIKEMSHDGITAVGDICNTNSTLNFKINSKIHWHNFIEVLSLSDANSEIRIQQNIALLNQFLNAGLKYSVISPHAPYSISKKTFVKINEITSGQTITIHNQESAAENELYITGSSALLELYEHLGYSDSPIIRTGMSSIKSILPHFNNGQQIILVHNTYMSDSDVKWANEYASLNKIKLVYCLCINANLYIENKCPDVPNFIRNGCRLVLGTDSYSSNWNLKISEEIKTIHQQFPDIPLQEILKWATINGLDTLNAPIKWVTGLSLLNDLGYE